MVRTDRQLTALQDGIRFKVLHPHLFVCCSFSLCPTLHVPSATWGESRESAARLSVSGHAHLPPYFPSAPGPLSTPRASWESQINNEACKFGLYLMSVIHNQTAAGQSLWKFITDKVFLFSEINRDFYSQSFYLNSEIYLWGGRLFHFKIRI